MPDHAVFVAEIFRILAPGGRALVSVWRDERLNPWATVLNESLAKHLGPEAAARRAASFQFGDREKLRSAFVAGGFEQITIEIVSLLIRHADPDQLVAEQLGHPVFAD
jgi:SAM-dependent methyltransferase